MAVPAAQAVPLFPFFPFPAKLNEGTERNMDWTYATEALA